MSTCIATYAYCNCMYKRRREIYLARKSRTAPYTDQLRMGTYTVPGRKRSTLEYICIYIYKYTHTHIYIYIYVCVCLIRKPRLLSSVALARARAGLGEWAHPQPGSLARGNSPTRLHASAAAARYLNVCSSMGICLCTDTRIQYVYI